MSTSRTRSRTPAADVGEQLVAAGRQILERDGESGLTVRTVAAEAGVAPMGVYSRFDGKDGLLNAVVTSGFVDFAAAIATIDDNPIDRLLNSGRAYRRFALANPNLYGLMFSSTCNPDEAAAGRAYAVLADIIRYAQVAGVIMAGEAEQLAMQVWSCVHGAVSLELAAAHEVIMQLPPAGEPERRTELHIGSDDTYEGVLQLIARGLIASGA